MVRTLLAKALMVVGLMACVLAVPVWAGVDRSALKKGMTLPEVVQAFGLPDSMEWVNFEGQPILFVFFESEDKGLLQGGPLGGDTIKRDDGRRFLPVGFLANELAGWGKKFYIRFKPAE
jgi:hypothetical protein